MYNISENKILSEWSITTLFKKIESGFNFEILKKGGKTSNTKGQKLKKAEADQLEALYYGDKNGR